MVDHGGIRLLLLGLPGTAQPIHEAAAAFIRSHAAASFFEDDAREPGEGTPRRVAE